MELENQEREIQMQNEPIIYSSGGEEYYAGNGIEINDENVISIDENVVQEKLTAGENITIDENNVISATGGDSNITTLTADDYNYTFDGHDCIAVWLLPTGTYKVSDDLSEEGFEPILLQMHGTPEDDPEEYWVERSTTPEREPLLIVQNTDYGDWQDISYHCIESSADTIFTNPINEYGNFENESVIALNQPFQGATEDENGASGLVPMPQMNSQDLFLKGSGEWAPIPPFEGTDGVDEGKSGAVPTPTVDDVDKYLNSNGAWEPLPMFQGIVGGADGEAGLVPAPAGSEVDKFLKSDGTWATAGPIVKPENFFTANATSTSTSSSSLSLTDTLNAKFEDVKLYGDTTQQTYTGKNLLPMKNTARTISDVTFTPQADGSIKLSGTASAQINYPINSNGVGIVRDVSLAAGTYTVSWGSTPASSGMFVQVYYAVDGGAGLYSTGTFTVNGTEALLGAYIRVNSGVNTDGVVIYPMLVNGSTSGDYEPYVGGVPAPNPDYPQAINVVTGTQTAMVVGKNLFDKDNVQGGNYYIDANQHKLLASASTYSCYIPIEEGVTYTVSKRVTSRFSIATTQSEPAANVSTADEHVGNTSTSLTLTASAGAKYLVIYFYREQSETATIAEIEATLQIEKGPLATPYEPYQGQSYTVRLGSLELAKIGDYQDYIYKSGDDWYVHKDLNKITFDGSENWGGTSGKYSYSDASIKAQPLGADEPPIAISNYLIGSNYSAIVNDLEDNIIAGYYNGGQLRVRVTDFVDSSAWTTWLTTHNMTVYYALNTSTDTKITDADLISDLNALANGNTYDGETNIIITATGTNLPALLKAEYYTKSLAGMNTILEGKQDELVAGTNITISGNVISSTAPSGPTVVQTTGTSQTDVMSQNATTSMVYADPSTMKRVQIGENASSTRNDAIAIGTGATAQGSNGSTAIGRNTVATGNYSTAIGQGSNVNRSYSIGIGGAVTTNNVSGAVALGYSSAATRTGEVNIGSTDTTLGFNSTNYRVIGGVHDGQNAHDAATKGQLDAISSYSETEVNTGATWIDGKTIYKKSYSQTITGNASQTFSLGIANLYEIVKMEAIWHAGGTLTNGMPTTTSFPGDSSNTNSITIITYGGTAEINSSGRSGMKGVITIYYTKSS